ncbi:hypothetical protein [Photobacterium phosphoreum]|nr:hypothetical protein [Photobacterium phosphoreum]
MYCRRDGCDNDIPRPTPREAINGYCSYVCQHIVKKTEKDKSTKTDE